MFSCYIRILVYSIILNFFVSCNVKDYCGFNKQVIEFENKEALDFSIQQDGKYIGNSTIVNNGINDVPLKKIKNQVIGKLVLRTSELYCNACRDSIISIINRFKSKISDSSIIVLANYRVNQYYTNWKLINNITFKSFNTYSSDGETFVLDNPNFQYMYLFYVDEYLMARNVFVPVKEDSLRTISYLNSITKKYFN